MPRKARLGMGNGLTAKRILAEVARHEQELRRYGVKRIGLFGSHAKGTARAGSDLDFLVAFEEPTFDNYMDVKFLLERLFRRRVALVTESGLKPALRYVRKEARYAT